MKYFLSIGSNIDAKKNLDFAYKELKNILNNIQSSSIYIKVQYDKIHNTGMLKKRTHTFL